MGPHLFPYCGPRIPRIFQKTLQRHTWGDSFSAWKLCIFQTRFLIFWHGLLVSLTLQLCHRHSLPGSMTFLAIESIRRSMFGIGNSSFGQTRLRFLKSTQYLIYPFFFFTGMILDNHHMCWMGLMKPAANSFYTSFTIYSSISVWNTLVGWATILALGSTLSVCTTNPRSSLGISL